MATLTGRLHLLAVVSCLSCVACGQTRPPDSGAASALARQAVDVDRDLAKALLLLHNFQFEQAIAAFKSIQANAPDFALGYWGESLSYNHPLQRMQNVLGPRQALERYGSSASGRLARARTPLEKGLIEAANVLFGDGDETIRKTGYAGAMERVAAAFPDNDDVQALFALSLLSAAQISPAGFEGYTARAGSVALQLFARRPDHAGAAHYLIHAFDDPRGAMAALPAARAYARLAPDSPHALHMPSHSFMELGLWDEVAESNAASYTSALRLLDQHRGPEAPSYESDVNHALDWKQYADLQRGDYAAASFAIERARDLLANSHNPRAIGVADLLLPRFVIETEQWQTIPISPFAPADCWLAVGLSAAMTGQRARALEAESELQRLATQSGLVVQVMYLEVRALNASLVHDPNGESEAWSLMTRATELDDRRKGARGAPRPLKPPHELFGEMLLRAGRAAQASREFSASLERMPNRLRSIVGLARSSARSGNLQEARRTYERLLAMWRGSEDDPLVTEGRRSLGGS